MDDTGVITYRVGGGERSPHWDHRWHVDFWFRSWQGESDNIMWCPRAWTQAGALRRVKKWWRVGTDIRKHEQRYGPRPDLWEKRFHG